MFIISNNFAVLLLIAAIIASIIRAQNCLLITKPYFPYKITVGACSARQSLRVQTTITLVNKILFCVTSFCARLTFSDQPKPILTSLKDCFTSSGGAGFTRYNWLGFRILETNLGFEFLLVWLNPCSVAARAIRKPIYSCSKGELHCKFEQCFVQSTVEPLFEAKNIGKSWTQHPHKPFCELFYFYIQKWYHFCRMSCPFPFQPNDKYPKFEAFLKSPSFPFSNYNRM